MYVLDMYYYLKNFLAYLNAFTGTKGCAPPPARQFSPQTNLPISEQGACVP